MMKRLEGRSLAHPGCLIGITLGLILGIVLAGVLATLFNIALNLLLVFWLILTLALGVLGWLIGERLSTKFTLAGKFTVPEDAPSETTSTDEPPSA
jgi:hypothetical protein